MRAAQGILHDPTSHGYDGQAPDFMATLKSFAIRRSCRATGFTL